MFTIHGLTTTTSVIIREIESIVATPLNIIITMRSGAKITHGVESQEEARKIHDTLISLIQALMK